LLPRLELCQKKFWSIMLMLPSQNWLANMGEGHLTGAFYAIVADAGLLKPTATGISVTGKYTSGEGWAMYEKQVVQLRNLFNTVEISIFYPLKRS
jgi:hypothetical protein